jgi:TPR repeat protein
MGPRGDATYKYRCAQAMNTGCAGWGDQKIIAGGSGDLSKAVESFTRGCDGGSYTSCVNLGGLTIIGQGTKKDRPRAHELFNKACSAGEPTACGEEGSLYFSDYLEQPADPQKGFGMLTQACDGGELDSCSLVLTSKMTGYGTTKALPEALAGLKTLCQDKKVIQACVSYGQALIADANEKIAADPSAQVQSEFDDAKKLYKDACDKNGDGCAPLADAFLKADATAQTAAYKKGCDKGQLEACSDLARAYQDGIGVDKDVKKAFELVERGCNRGHATSCGRLGVFYLEGTPDVKQDAKKGAGLLKESCDDGDSLACSNYGVCLLTGTGVDKDASSAGPYLKRGCAAGIKDACDHLKEASP